MVAIASWTDEDEADLAAAERDVERLSYAPLRGGFGESRRLQLAVCVRCVAWMRDLKERLA